MLAVPACCPIMHERIQMGKGQGAWAPLKITSCYMFPLKYWFVCLFVCFVALRPKSTAMVIAGRSVHLTTLFPGQA